MSGIEDASSKSGPDKNNKHGLKPDQFMVGAPRNFDGTRDTSRALVFEDPTGKTAASFERQAAREKAERKEKMRIPEEAAPGTTHRLWYEMRNAVYVQKEGLENDRNSEHRYNERRREHGSNTVRELEAQQGLLEEIEKMKIKSTFDETPRGKTFDAGEAHRGAETMPVAEALEYLEIIDTKLMDEIDAAEKATHYVDAEWKARTIVNLEKKHASVGELLKKLSTAASSAQDRLRNP